MKTENEHVSDL